MIKKDIFSSEKCEEAERSGSFLNQWLFEAYRQKWFKLFVPNHLGGLELGLPEALRIEEELARIDGSLGWTVTLCAGAGWFVGFMEDSLRQEVFSNAELCVAGSGFVGGEADKIGDSFIISGNWTYASGALHATHFTANCIISDSGKNRLGNSGEPVIKAFILKREEVEILDSWKYMGMIATGSHAFKVDKLIVPLNRCFEILPEKVKLKSPLYLYPFLQFAETTLTVNVLGLTLHFQELIEKTFWERNSRRKFKVKEVDYFKKVFQKEKKKILEKKEIFYKIIDDSWAEIQKEGEISKGTLAKVSNISRKMIRHCRSSNAKLYPFAGLEAAKTQTELNRVWRDFNTVSQHSLLTFPF